MAQKLMPGMKSSFLFALVLALLIPAQVEANYEIKFEPPYTGSTTQAVFPLPPKPGVKQQEPQEIRLKFPTLFQLPVSSDTSPSARSNASSPQPARMEQVLEVRPGTYVFANNSCCGLTDQQKHFGVFALRGSLYSVEAPGKIRLARGRLLAINDEGPLEISSQTAMVSVEPKSAIIIESSPSGMTRVYALVSHLGGRPAASVSILAGGLPPGKNSCLNLVPGQELVVPKGDNLSEELIPVDGIARRPAKGEVLKTLPDNVVFSEFSLAQMADWDRLIFCSRNFKAPSPKLARLLKDDFEGIIAFATAQDEFPSAKLLKVSGLRLNSPSSADLSASAASLSSQASSAGEKRAEAAASILKYLAEVDNGKGHSAALLPAAPEAVKAAARQQPSEGSPAAALSARQLGDAPLAGGEQGKGSNQAGADKAGKPPCLSLLMSGQTVAVAASDARVERIGESLNLSQGLLLVKSRKLLRIVAGDKEIRAGRGAIVSISLRGDNLKVSDLSDKRKGSVTVIASGKSFLLWSGREILLSHAAPALSDVYYPHSIAHRFLSAHEAPGIGWVTTSEICLKDAVLFHPLLTLTRQSPALGKLAAEVTKTAAAMELLRGGIGHFEKGVPSDDERSAQKMAARCNHCMN